MTLAMCAYVVFPAYGGRGQVAMRHVSEVELRTSVHDVCQTGTITLPRNVSELQQQQLRTFIRRGDPVQVYLGYDGNLELEFDGFVERVGAETPVRIDLRDALWKVLQQPFTKSYKSTHVPTLVKDLVGDGFQVQAMDATIGPMRFEKATVAAAFKTLKDEFGLVTYLKNGTVFVGELYDANAGTATYVEDRNFKSSDLKYRVADDVKLKVTAKSTLRNGDHIEVEVGDKEGEQRTLTYYGIASKEELKKIAEQDMQRFKYDGYEGSFKAFGIPVCRYGDKVELRSPRYPERDGTYLAEGSTISFGPGGFERNIKLAQRWTH